MKVFEKVPLAVVLHSGLDLSLYGTGLFPGILEFVVCGIKPETQTQAVPVSLKT